MSTILTTDLTDATTVASGVSNGTGIFDKLMNSTVLYLDDQYNTGRIKGTDYANVLLGSIQAVLQQSVHLLLQKDKVTAEIDLLDKEKDLKRIDVVIKDKTCAALGLDDVMKMVNDAKNSTIDYVYSPKYLQ